MRRKRAKRDRSMAARVLLCRRELCERSRQIGNHEQGIVAKTAMSIRGTRDHSAAGTDRRHDVAARVRECRRTYVISGALRGRNVRELIKKQTVVGVINKLAGDVGRHITAVDRKTLRPHTGTTLQCGHRQTGVVSCCRQSGELREEAGFRDGVLDKRVVTFDSIFIAGRLDAGISQRDEPDARGQCHDGADLFELVRTAGSDEYLRYQAFAAAT